MEIVEAIGVHEDVRKEEEVKYKENKNLRTLDMYVRFCEGKVLNKREEALRFGVDERSIQRDFNDIRTFLAEHAFGMSGKREIIYDRKKDGFILTGLEGSLMSNDEILAVSKILLESRAFTKKEMGLILEKMVSGCVPLKNMKLVSDLIANEKYHYVELKHNSSVKNKLWELGEEIKQSNLLEIKYIKQVHTKETVKRIIQPVGIIFSEYYFYLNAFIVEQNNSDEFERKYDYPAVFRIDRIVDYKEIGVKFKIPYADRFEEGEFRKRVQFMFPGELVHLQFKYYGTSVEAILDRLPTAKIISEKDGALMLEAEVYGKGVLMWLLSQGNNIEITKPQKVREEFIKLIEKMLERYR